MNIIDTVWQYIYKYFINGIVNDTSYNIIDTLTYAIVLGISLFWVLKLLEKLEIRIDTRFMTAVTPFILAGSSLRVLEDLNVFTPPLRYLFVTPVIYFLMFAVTIGILALSRFLERKGKIKDYHGFFCYAGIIWTAINILAILAAGKITHPFHAAAILLIGITITAAVFIIAKLLDSTLLTDRLNISLLFAHLLDASSTYVGMDWLGYYEKHVAPTFFIEIAENFTDHPSMIMFILKLLVFIPVIYLLDRPGDDKEKNLIALVKLAILVLGLSPAVRNSLRILMGV